MVIYVTIAADSDIVCCCNTVSIHEAPSDSTCKSYLSIEIMKICFMMKFDLCTKLSTCDKLLSRCHSSTFTVHEMPLGANRLHNI